MFEIFEPMIVPIGISPASLNMLEIPMNISGADVPNAINVRPISKSLTPNLFAKFDEWKTNFSAPQIKRAIPTIARKKF